MTWYFGSDLGTTSNTQACATSGGSFYIGRLGHGTTPTTTKQQIWYLPSGSSRAGFPYWNIEGPESSDRPSGITPEAWGSSQAKVFFSGWNKVYRSGGNLVGKGRRGKTLFGSVSWGSGGWSTTNIDANRAVVNGFLSELTAEFDGTGTVGIYGNKCCELHCVLEASDWIPPVGIVVWYANPLDVGCTEIETDYCDGYGMPDVGGYTPMIWQYHGDPDYDISPFAGGPVDLEWHPTTSPGYCSTSYKLVSQCSAACFASYCD